MKINFKCPNPKCNSTVLRKSYRNVLSVPVVEIEEDEYGDVGETLDRDLLQEHYWDFTPTEVEYECAKCHVLLMFDGQQVTDPIDLYKWLKKAEMVETCTNEKT